MPLTRVFCCAVNDITVCSPQENTVLFRCSQTHKYIDTTCRTGAVSNVRCVWEVISPLWRWPWSWADLQCLGICTALHPQRRPPADFNPVMRQSSNDDFTLGYCIYFLRHIHTKNNQLK